LLLGCLPYQGLRIMWRDPRHPGKDTYLYLHFLEPGAAIPDAQNQHYADEKEAQAAACAAGDQMLHKDKGKKYSSGSVSALTGYKNSKAKYVVLRMHLKGTGGLHERHSFKVPQEGEVNYHRFVKLDQRMSHASALDLGRWLLARLEDLGLAQVLRNGSLFEVPAKQLALRRQQVEFATAAVIPMVGSVLATTRSSLAASASSSSSVVMSGRSSAATDESDSEDEDDSKDEDGHSYSFEIDGGLVKSLVAEYAGVPLRGLMAEATSLAASVPRLVFVKDSAEAQAQEETLRAAKSIAPPMTIDTVSPSLKVATVVGDAQGFQVCQKFSKLVVELAGKPGFADVKENDQVDYVYMVST
jgi:hypothetical protein